MQQLSSPASVFCLAAPSDVALLAEWETHLFPLQQAGLITIWSERLVQLGTVPRMQQIHDHLDHADLIVLLLSSDFFAHYECFVLMERAIKRAERNEVRLIPLLLRPVAWRESPLAPYQCLPTNKHPVTEWASRDAAFNDCVRDIRYLLGRPVTKLLPHRDRSIGGVPQTGKGHQPPWAKKSTIVGVLLLILVLLGGYGAFHFISSHTLTPVPSQVSPTQSSSGTPTVPPTPLPSPSTFTQTGSWTSPSFSEKTSWGMSITCTPTQTTMRSGALLIDVVNDAGEMMGNGPVDVEVCSGWTTPEYQGGTFHLEINARSDIEWIIHIRLYAS